MVADTLQDTCDMDVSWHQYATAVIDKLLAAGLVIENESSNALNDIAAERERQVNVEGWTVHHDDEHGNAQLARAAASYALGTASHTYADPASRKTLTELSGHIWPWDSSWHKPTAPRRDLVKAGALIVAEIDRLDRITADEIPT
jgi:hypothetical protein